MTLDGSPLTVLFIGGTGTISTSSVRLAVASGMNVFVLNRRRRAIGLEVADAVTWLTGDITDPESVRSAIGDLRFDAVVNFLTFGSKDAKAAIEIFRGRTRHYLHISTASLYGKPVKQWPIVESAQRHNAFVAYSRAKLEAEQTFFAAFADEGFPMTIVRPSHTYDDANPPVPGEWTVFDRIARGAEIVVPGDGTSLWTLTHAEDFAQGLVGLLGNPRAVGEAFHITGNDVHTWDQIYTLIAAALGVEAKLVHVPSELILAAAPDWFWSKLIIGDLSHSAVFDNTKIRSIVPGFSPTRTFHRSVVRMVAWRAAHGATTGPDAATDAVIDRLVAGYHGARRIFEALAPAP